MADLAYLSKHLVGLEVENEGLYCSGKYTGCTETLIEGFLAVSCCSFVRTASHVKGGSKRFKAEASSKSSIFFSHANGTVPIPFHGYPFELIATEKWTCNEASAITKKSLQSHKREIQEYSCNVSIQIRKIRRYTEYGLTNWESQSENDLKKAKESMKESLLSVIKSGGQVKSTEVHYCRFPLESAHDHSENTSRTNSTHLDKRVINKIREIAKNGICDIPSIKSMSKDFVLNTLFAHAEENEKPKLDNKRYFPTDKTIRNHVFLAIGNVPKTVHHGNKKHSESEDINPPSITNIVEIPFDKVNLKRRRKIDVGFVAVHAGAGYHSDERWPGYKHLCKSVCNEVCAALKEGRSAGEAVTLAVALLENSELTNAGFGSNLTESGKVECDACVMDTTPSSDPSNQCNSYFGSVACLSKVKNPVCAAYKILNERRKRSRLELGRVPPSFLVSDGAENWCRAHGIGMCDSDELISESAYKSWQKYHKKLLQKLASQNNSKDIMIDSEDHMQKRLDTVGAVVLDLDGNVAAAVSSGGLILKMPGRVGQAALYGCGCWAEPGESESPVVAVTTSGCGEQLISTILAKKCAENLQNQTQPYQALQDTLVKNFLGSPMLNTECDKQAGLLCLHQSMEGSQCTVEVVWGHTTSSMVVGHMSTNDANPKVVLSRLPENATPGKSVTVGGSWTKVACSDIISMHPKEAEVDERLEFSTENGILNSVDGLSDEHQDSIDPEISVMFASPIPEGLTESVCKVEISEEYNRKIDPEFEKCIQERWEARVAQNPRFFNAQKFRVHSVTYTINEENQPQFTFHLGLSCYKDYMETNWAKEVKTLQENGIRDYGNSQAYLAEPLGVAAIIITDDEKVVFQWRNSWLAESAGMLDVPGGHPEPTDSAGVDIKQFVTIEDLCPEKIVHEIFHSQVKEVRDEVNVAIENIGEPIFTGLIRNNLSGGRPVAYFYMQCHMTSEEILQQYQKGGAETDESTKLEFIPEEEIRNLQTDKFQFWKKMCPNGKAACILYSMLKKKTSKK